MNISANRIEHSRRQLGDLQDRWRSQVGDDFPLPTFSAATIADYRVRTRAARVRDAIFITINAASAVRTAGIPEADEGHVRMWVVDRGSWTPGETPDTTERAVPAGQFILRHVGKLTHFALAPDTRAKVLVLPAETLAPLLRGRATIGPASTAEVRLLLAHAGMVHRTLTELGPAGLQAARDTLVELARAVARGDLDDAEPQLYPALAQAAKDLAERRLAEPGLGAAMLAAELSVSVRTLQRAFAATGQSLSGYVRARRLDEARSALLAAAPWSVSEIAAYWQFADSSHFGRAFKRRYGRSPTDFARAARPPA